MSRADFVVICRALVLWPAPLPLCCGSGDHAFLGLELGWALARLFGICCGSQGCCPGLTGQLCDRAAVPDGRCTFTASSLAAAGVVHALLGLVCGRLKPGGWRRCVRGAFGDLCLGRPYTSGVWRALRMGAAGSQTCAGGGGGYAAVWHERDPRGGGTLTRCATGDVRVLPRVCVFACGFSKILAQPCLSFGFARRVVCVCACVCAVSLCTCRAFLLVASSPPVPPNDAICDFYCPYRAFVTATRRRQPWTVSLHLPTVAARLAATDPEALLLGDREGPRLRLPPDARDQGAGTPGAMRPGAGDGRRSTHQPRQPA